MLQRLWCGAFILLASVSTSAAAPQKVIARIDLSKPFHLPPGAAFTATQGPDVQDPNGDEIDRIPGSIHLCVRTSASARCAPDLNGALGYDLDKSSISHFLQVARIVYPRGIKAPPLLHLQVASPSNFNGSQGHATIILTYRASQRRFEQILVEVFGGNMNQEARYMDDGPLKGAIVTVHPTENAPFAYWVAVHRLTPDYRYRQVLRYRSATRYNDGNPIAVIDSEMPNILRRLGLWRRGQPLPLPAGRCPRPHLVNRELWCW